MANNVFLTGEKGIGKSTIINNFLKTYDGKVGGFKTIRNIHNDGLISFHMVKVNSDEILNDNNLLFYRGKRPSDVHERFDKLSIILDDYKNYDLIIMDEIGPSEYRAEIFKSKIIDILNSEIKVLGVLQKADSDFLNSIASRKDTLIYDVNLQNRNNIYIQL